MPTDRPAPDLPIPDRIAAALTEEIVRGDRLPGEKLAQDHIAQSFQTSHVPVREALLRLVARGLATNEPRRGVRVAPFSAAATREVVEMRIALEPLALRRAAAHMTAADLALAEAARQACDAAEDAYAWEKQNRAFHLAILRPCRMPRLLAEIEVLQQLNARHFHASWRSSWEARTDQDHRAIMAALLRKDVEGAAMVLRRHLDRI
ncbi:MAG: GntR family transcriptional regulator [Rhodobacteraceae bacterium]|nr:GntR family transcriptional regulator [Paracoccaceae bacterium]